MWREYFMVALQRSTGACADSLTLLVASQRRAGSVRRRSLLQLSHCHTGTPAGHRSMRRTYGRPLIRQKEMTNTCRIS